MAKAKVAKRVPAKKHSSINVRNRLTIGLIFAFIFAILGYYFLRTSDAAIVFPGPGTVGHLASINGVHSPAALTQVGSSLTTSADGQVIQAKDVNGAIFVKHKNVVIRDSKMRALSVDPSGSATCEWCTIGDPNGIRQNDPQLGSSWYNAVGMYNFKLYRSEIFGAVDLIKLRGGYAEVKESWLHEPIQWSSDPAQGGGPSHPDMVQTTLASDVSSLKLIDNYWDAWTFSETQKVGSVWRNLEASKTMTGIVSLFQHKTNYRLLSADIRGNIFNGDAYFMLYALNNNYGQPPQNVTVTSNIFYQNYPEYGKNGLASVDTRSAIVWGCNINEKKAVVGMTGATLTSNCTVPGSTVTNTPDFTIKGLVDGAVVSNGMTVEATPTNATTPSFEFWLDDKLINTERTAPFCFSQELNGACQSHGTSTLTGTEHKLKIIMNHAAGQLTKILTFTTPSAAPVADTLPPTTPSNLVATAAGTTQINLSWNPSIDNVGVVGYEVWRLNGTLLTTTTGTSYGVTGLVSGSTYNFYVKAVDGAGNLSAASGTASATTAQVSQVTSGTLKGIVTGNGGTLRRPRISLRFAGSTHTYAPNKKGEYLISGVPAGVYEVAYSARDYTTQVIRITIESGKATTQNVQLVK